MKTSFSDLLVGLIVVVVIFMMVTYGVQLLPVVTLLAH